MSPASGVVEFIDAWPLAKASIEEKLANPYDVDSGVLDPVLTELGVWHGFAMRHLKSIGDYELRINGLLDLWDFAEDLRHSLADDEAGSSPKSVDFEMIGLAESLKNKGRSTRVDFLKTNLVSIRDEILDLYEQRRLNVGHRWVLDRAN
jgi:hypothetical protein